MNVVKVPHKHEWFRTGEMKVGQMRCISCGTWAEEEMQNHTWQGLTLEEKQQWIDALPEIYETKHLMKLLDVMESRLKARNT